MEPRPTSPATPRQTQSYLRTLFGARRLSPKKKLGQNFLIDLNLMEVILAAAELTRDDLVLEVGTGTGSLTAQLADRAGAVLSVEVDADFHQLARETLLHRPHVRLLHADILQNKNRLNPGVLEQLRAGLQQGKFSRLKLVANLPYAVATPVIANLLLTELPVERMVVTVQWEIAERLLAAPGTKDFGALAVLVQSVADVEMVRKLPPSVFWPRPQIDSAIVRIWPRAPRRQQIPDVQGFRNFLRDLYAHRRKNLRGGLLALPRSPKDKPALDATLVDMGLDPRSRAETLSLADHIRLFTQFGSWSAE